MNKKVQLFFVVELIQNAIGFEETAFFFSIRHTLFITQMKTFFNSW
jgi:hypothetical protein